MKKQMESKAEEANEGEHDEHPGMKRGSKKHGRATHRMKRKSSRSSTRS